jgi:hypothetical protein
LNGSKGAFLGNAKRRQLKTSRRAPHRVSSSRLNDRTHYKVAPTGFKPVSTAKLIQFTGIIILLDGESLFREERTRRRNHRVRKWHYQSQSISKTNQLQKLLYRA